MTIHDLHSAGSVYVYRGGSTSPQRSRAGTGARSLLVVVLMIAIDPALEH